MNKLGTIVGLAIAASALTASADVLIEVDLSVVNEMVITATEGNSAITASGSDFSGILLEGILNGNGGVNFNFMDFSDFTAAQNITSGFPGLWQGGDGTDNGLNIFDISSGPTLDFSAGRRAFTGSIRMRLNSTFYNNLAAGNTSGNIYFPAENDSQIPGAEILGTYRVVPAPNSLALLGLTGMIAGRRRR